MITREQAVLAYRLMLGRDPENEDVVTSLCQNTHNTHALRDVFIKSPEFVQRMGELLKQPQQVRHRHPYHLPKIPVETEASDEAMGQMFERIQQAWAHLGSTEPYWSVLTQPQYVQAEFEAHRQQFFDSGNHSCQLFLAALRRSGINPAELSTCLEVGCGVGRVTGYLAGAFSQVLAADISQAHLNLAQQHLQAQGASNVTWLHWRTVQQMRELPQVDAIFSLITLQHNPPPVMAWMLRTLLSCLRSGGAAYIQLPTYRHGYLFEVQRYLHSAPTQALEMHFLPQPDVFAIVEQANCRCLEIREDAMVGDEDKMLSNSFLIQKK